MGQKRLKLNLVFLITAVLLITSLAFVSPVMATVYKYTMDGGNFGGVFLSDESFTNYATDETKQIIAQVIDPDGSVNTSVSPTIMTDVDFRPVFEIWITRNSMKTPDQIAANEAKIHLQTEDGSQDIAITYQAINSTYRYYCIQPVKNLDPSTIYRIFVDKGIQLGSSVTTCQYIAKFSTKAAESVWPAETTAEITNLGSCNLTLNWPPVVADSAVAYYQVLQVEDENPSDKLDINSTSYNVDGLLPDTDYTFVIKAFDKNDVEKGSLTVNAKTKLPEGTPDTEDPAWTGKTLDASGITTGSLTLNWSGADDNVGVTGYEIFKDGDLLTKNIGQDKSSYTVTGLTDATTYNFKVEARDAVGNWSEDGPELIVRTAYTLEKEADLTEGTLVYFEGGVIVTPDSLEAGNNNTVTVRDAFGEIPYNHASEERPLEWSMLYYANLRDAGGYYGFNFAADSAAVNDVMTVTLPITDSAKLAEDKVGVFMLDWFWEDPARQFIAHTWKKLDAVIDKENATATVTINGGNQDIVLGVLSNTYGPDGISLTTSARTDDPSITLDMICNSTSGLAQIGIKKEKYVSCSTDPIISNFIIKNTENHQYITATGTLDNYKCTYTDTDVEPGAFYRYSVDLAATFDALNNSPLTGFGSASTIAGSDATGFSSLKQMVTDGKQFAFAEGDSVDSVTQDFTVSVGPFATTLWGIKWSSDNTDIITIDGLTANVTRPEDKDTVVNLTATVTFNGLTDSVIIPVTVKQADTPYLADLDTKILAGVAADTLTALKSAVLGLVDVRDANAEGYQSALKAARDTKDSALTINEIKVIVSYANDAADVAAGKTWLVAHTSPGLYYSSTGEIIRYNVDSNLGVSVAWTAVSGPDANRVTLNADGTATLNSLPAYGDVYGSITMTETLTKGNATDAVDYTFELRGREVKNSSTGYFTSNLITMSSDGVTPSDDYWYLQIIPYQDEDGTRWANGTTIKDTIGHDDISITGLPEGLDYTVEKVGYNDVKITLTGMAATVPTTVSNIGIVIKASAIEEENACNSNVFAAKLNPFQADMVIDYSPFSLTDGLPWQDASSHSNIGFTQFVRAAKVDAVKTITLNDPLYLFNEEDIKDFAKDPNYVIDLHGATIVAGFEGNDTTNNYRNYLLCTGTGPTVTLKNAVIDMNHKNFKTVFNAKGILHLENVSIINSENTEYGVMSWSNNTKSYGNGTVNNGHFVADKCQFGHFKTAGVLQWTPGFVLSELLDANSKPFQVKLTECTFDGANLPGYGVVGCYGSIVIDACTFTGYKGSVATGAASTSDYYAVPQKPTFVDYRLILPYKGIPDNSPSAAILLKEVTAAKSVSGNTISDCDNGILVWTGEQNFHQYDQRPVIGYAGYVQLNGANVVTTADSAQSAYDYLISQNNIANGTGVNVKIENAANRYNRSSLIAGTETTAIASINNAIQLGVTADILSALKSDIAGLDDLSAENASLYQESLSAARTAKGSALTKAEIQAVIDNVNATTLTEDTEAVASVRTALTNAGLNMDLYAAGDINIPSGADANGVTAKWTAMSGPDVFSILLNNGKAVLATQPAADAESGSVTLTLTLNKGAASDTLEYNVTIYPLGTGTVTIDYEDGSQDAAWAKFQAACNDSNITAIILNRPVGVGEAIKADKIPQIVFVGFDENSNIIDCKGKTIKLGADMDYMLYSGEGESITLKNAIIDLDHKNAKSAIMCTGAMKMENVNLLNGENVISGITVPDAEIVTKVGNRLILNNCNFGDFKMTAILEAGAYPTCVSTGYNAVNSSDYDQYAGKTNASLTSAALTNCTFNSNGKPGFGIVGCFETLNVTKCTFSGYNGKVVTGTTWANEVFDGNPYLKYKGIPDGTPSAAILLKEVSTSNLSGNTIKDCQNGILIWTGEKDFRHYGTTPNSNWTGYVEANDVWIKDTHTSINAYETLAKANSISLIPDSNGSLISIENAADRYKRTILYTQHYIMGTPVLTLKGGEQPVNSLERTKTYTLTIPVATIGTDVNTKAYVVLRGGKGARADHGGTVFYDATADASLHSTEVKLESNQLKFSFTMPAGVTGKVYGNAIIWNDQQTYPEAAPVNFVLDVK